MILQSKLERFLLTSAALAAMAAMPALAQDTGNASQPAARASRMENGHSQRLSSSAVRDAQQALKEKGYYNGEVDGVIGPKTRSALRQYQQKENLPANGRLTQETAQQLGMNTTPGEYFESAGHAIVHKYGEAGREVGHGASRMGHEMKKGEVGSGAKEFGKGVGKGAKDVGSGTAKAAKKTYKGTKDAITPDNDNQKRNDDKR